jgi:two-component SAPR family response regulator
MKKSILIFLMLSASILLSFVWATQADDGMDAGLYFHSFRVDKDSRTGLDLTPEKPLSFPKGFTLSFDFKIRPEKDFFGYIFRIIADRKTNIDMVSNISDGNLVLVAGNSTLLDFKLSEIRGGSRIWTKAELTVNSAGDTLELEINGIRKSAKIDLSNMSKYNFHFGSNSNIQFATTDVAPFILKNVGISDHRKQLKRFWKLDRHRESCVYDECRASKAVVTNPVWEIDSHAEWKKHTSMLVPGKHPQITFDRERKRFFIAKDKFLYIHNAEYNTTDTLAAVKGMPLNTDIDQMIFDGINNQPVMYDFTKKALQRFDFASRSWTNESDTPVLSSHAHHNRYFDRRTQTIHTFGGYGYHRYSAMLQSFSAANGEWEQKDLSGMIHPRYLAAMGEWNDSLLLCFGGYGSASGKQSESSHNFYDLYSINPHSADVKKIWELKFTGQPFTNSNSLVVNSANQLFYTLSYPNNVFKAQIYLHEYRLDKPEFRQLGNPLPFPFYDVESYCDLYMPSDSSALYAVASYVEDGQSRIDIYSISYPPLSMTDIMQANHNRNTFPYLMLCLLLCVAAMMYPVIKYVRRKRQIRFVAEIIESNRAYAESRDMETTVPDGVFPAINVLNEFEILDPQGVNISNLFTPIMSHLFFLLYFKTVKDGKGITSGELQKMLWPFKDDENARNNRNVYFNRVRSILNAMGGIVTLNKTNDFWQLSYGSDKLYSDYEQVLKNIDLLKKKKKLDKKLLNETLEIAGKGKLLPFCEIEWLDDYKNAYANTVIEFLSELTVHPDVKNDLALLLNISEVILIQDGMEETGIRLKCRVLSKSGKKKQALHCYNKYAEEFFNLLNAKPEHTFEEMLK